jgi:hypothetical protein
VFYALSHGDFGPLIFGCVVFAVGIPLLLNTKGIARHMAERVVERFPIYRRLGGVSFGYWTARLAGLVGVLMGIGIVLFA